MGQQAVAPVPSRLPTAAGAHQFRRQVNQDFPRCVLFDGNTVQAAIGLAEVKVFRVRHRPPVVRRSAPTAIRVNVGAR